MINPVAAVGSWINGPEILVAGLIMSALLVLLALILSAGLIVLLRPLLVRYALARPNARSSHREPTPQGGGAAVIVATIVVATPAALIMPDPFTPLLPAFGAAALLAVVGAFDDIRPLGAGTRLILHLLAVITVVAALPSETRVIWELPWWLERAFLVAGGVWFVNLVNFMDGIDWMTVVEAGSITAGLSILGVLAALPWHGTLVAPALLGAILGFAPFNRPVARLFLGDVGSLPIGLLIGWLLLLLAARGHLAAAVLLPLYYVADATVTLLRRLVKGEPVWQAHRTHFYQRATDHGFTVREIVARVLAVNVVLVALAVATVRYPSPAVSAGALVAGAALVAWLLWRFSRG
jgi:UDP-N-acetylmuramyl pentapeptide phosphotransferase/UDP-N-acetylglucosamine-1-phosphate transferase